MHLPYGCDIAVNLRHRHVAPEGKRPPRRQIFRTPHQDEQRPRRRRQRPRQLHRPGPPGTGTSQRAGDEYLSRQPRPKAEAPTDPAKLNARLRVPAGNTLTLQVRLRKPVCQTRNLSSHALHGVHHLTRLLRRFLPHTGQTLTQVSDILLTSGLIHHSLDHRHDAEQDRHRCKNG